MQRFPSALFLFLFLGLMAGSPEAQHPDWTQLPWQERIGPGWYRNLAEARDPEAQYRFALLIEAGMVDAASLADALRWYRAAADQGHEGALEALARLRDAGEPERVADHYRQAANAGSPDAAFNLAIMLENGQGIAANEEEAAFFFELAFAGGIAEAALHRGLLEMKRRKPEPVRALAWLLRAREAGAPSASEAIALLAADLSAEEREAARAIIAAESRRKSRRR